MEDLVVSAVAALLMVITFDVVDLVIRRGDARKKLRVAEEGRFQSLLTEGSLTDLGQYLDRSLGSFTAREYAGNAEVRDRVNSLIGRLQEFVGSIGDIEASSMPPGPNVLSREPADFELNGVEARLLEGRPWDALAALRRTIEVRLLALAQRHELKVPRGRGAGQLLEMLRSTGKIEQDAVASLRYAIGVANRGVHGLDVEASEIYEALAHARRGFASMKR